MPPLRFQFTTGMFSFWLSLTDQFLGCFSENKNVIVVNLSCPLALGYAPAYKAYYHQPLPRTLRALVSGCTSFDVQRTDDKTLVIQSKAPDIFFCDDVGPVHLAYLCRTGNLLGYPRCKKGDRYDLGSLTVEILESDASDLPSRVAFRFDTSLDSPDFHWLRFDGRTGSYQPFKIPAIGQSVTLSGPPPITLAKFLRVILQHVPRKKLAGLSRFNFCVPSACTARIFALYYGSDQTFCRVATGPQTGRAHL